jgi:peptidoglycan-associated lipoprotein
MNGRIRILAVYCLVFAMTLFFAVGCGKQQVQVDEGMRTPDAAQRQAQDPRGAAISPGDEESLDTPRFAEMAAPALSEGRTHAPMQPIYFDYDSSSIREDQRARIERNAAFLKDNPHVIVRIEGNCDNRGTNEYNMALGERRAMSAKNYLINLGIEEKRIVQVSYGEEKPLATGDNERAWAQNRRDDFVIINR